MTQSLIDIVDRAMQYQQAGQPEQAAAYYAEALCREPHHPELHLNLGSNLRACGQPQRAIKHFHQAISLRPEFTEAHYNLALTQSDLGDIRNAEASYQQALVLKPDLVPGHVNLANLYFNSQQYEQALLYYQSALRYQPNHINALIGLGTTERLLGQTKAAFANLQQAQQYQPDNVRLLEQLALVLIDLLQHEEALTCLQRLISLQPANVDALVNTGGVLNLLGRYDEAIAHYDLALNLDPQHAHARWNRALLFLLMERWIKGWAEYQWRWSTPARTSFYPHTYAQPRWQGEPLTGQRLLVHYEQGLGDVLQFLRYLPLVKARGGTVLLEVPQPIAPLVEDWDCLDQVIVATNEPVSANIDVTVSLLDLPSIFQTTLDTIPPAPYFRANSAKQAAWTQRLSHPGFKIGLVWAGGQVHHQRLSVFRQRACRLEYFHCLSELPGVNLYGLQKDTGLDEINPTTSSILTANIGQDFHDFSDTAAALSHLDLVISVDTSVAHLAGALGCATWTLLKFDADWRWLLERNDSPWYPTMRLFRQQRGEQWPQVIERLQAALVQMLSSKI